MQPERSFLLNTNHKVREHILRLTKPVKARFLRILFSRFLLFALLIILQFTLLGILLYILDEYFPWLAATLVLTAGAVVVYLFNTDMDSSAKPSSAARARCCARKKWAERPPSTRVRAIMIATMTRTTSVSGTEYQNMM